MRPFLFFFLAFAAIPEEALSRRINSSSPPIKCNIIRDGALQLFNWRADDGTANFGDELSLSLVKAILPLNVSRATSGDRMFAVGSILHFDERADECILVWGSGIRDLPLPNSKGLRNSHLLAVRGPHTWQALRFHGIKMRRIYGDPALFLPMYFPEFHRAPVPEQDVLLIPHKNDVSIIHANQDGKTDRRLALVLPTEDWRTVVRAICNSKLVISSSLHGLIVSEAFGVPAIFLRLSDHEPLFKYNDYYSATNRSTFPVATSIQDALSIRPPPPPAIDLRPSLHALGKYFSSLGITINTPAFPPVYPDSYRSNVRRSEALQQ